MILVREDVDPEVVITRHGSDLIRDVSTSLDMTIVVLKRLATQLWPTRLADMVGRFPTAS